MEPDNKLAPWTKFSAIAKRMPLSLIAYKGYVVTSRRLPWLVGIGASIATLCLWQGLNALERDRIQQKINLEAEIVKIELIAEIEERFLALVRMAKRWEKAGKPSQEDWEAAAILNLQHFSGYQAIEWVDPAFNVRWIVSPEKNGAVLSQNISLEERRQLAVEAAENRLKADLGSRPYTVTRFMNLVQGGKGFLVYVPIFPGEKFDGFMLGVFENQELFNSILHPKIAQGYAIAIYQDNQEIYHRHDPSSHYPKQWRQNISLNLNGVNWRLQIWPEAVLLDQEQSRLPEVILGAGLLMAWLLALAVRLAQAAQRRAQQVEAINQGLAKEMSDRIAAEEALRERESILRSFYDSAVMMMGIVEILDDDIMHISDNAATAQFFGLPQEAMQYRLASEMGIPPEYRREWIHHYRQSEQKSCPIRFEYAHKTGTEQKWMSAAVFAIPKTEGRQAQYSYIVEDITERKQAEETLQATTSLQRAIFDSANYTIISTTLDGTICSFNAAAEKCLGYAASEVVGKTTPAIFHDQNEVGQRAQELSVQLGVTIEPGFEVFVAQAQRGNMDERQWTYIRKDGSRFPVLLSITALRDIEGNITGFVGIGSDITKRKAAEEALRESEERYRDLFENANDLIQSLAPDGCLIYVNRTWQETLGYSKAEIAGMSVFDVIHPEYRAHFQEFFGRIKTGEKLDRIQTAFTTKNGRTILLDGSISSKFIDGKLVSARAIFRDITERQQSEQALQQANQKLTSWIKELEQRNHEIALLGEMSEVLQACLTVEEAHNAIAQLVQPIFPDVSGGIFVTSASRKLVEAVTSWGAPPSQKLFAPDECWALRRGRSHLIEGSHAGLLCKHIHPHPVPAYSLCVPMMAQGEAMGTLYLSAQEPGQLTEAKQRLAVTVAESIALALANLSLYETLQKQSIRDPLTGLYNRRYLEESLLREIHRAERKQQSVGVIMLDVDHFKRFNDTFGHEAGDAVLRELGLFLRKQIRESDIACRYGGEELTLILPEASLEDTAARAEQIREGVKHLQVQSRRQQLGVISISLGVAAFPLHGTTGEAVVQAADAALYLAKAQGRDRVSVYT